MVELALFPLNLKYDFNRQFDASMHVYTIDGIFVPGVTTVLGLLPKPALVPWAAKMTATAIAQSLEAGRIYNRKELDDSKK